ncbi:hypothetical protein CsSME_00020046 [Camellia sinensis var. sinensis]
MADNLGQDSKGKEESGLSRGLTLGDSPSLQISPAYELRKKIRGLDQKDRSLAVYYAELSGLWQELDFYQSFQPVCSKDATMFQQAVEKEREESRRSAMVHAPVLDRSAMVVGPKSRDTPPFLPPDRHDKKHCWKLHGRPTRGRGRGGGVRPQAHVSETTASASNDASSISPNELHTLRRLMARLDSSSALAPSSSASSNFAHTGISASIIDSGATDHMTGTSSFFHSYSPSSGQDKELATGKMIGSGRAQSGLYFLDAMPASPLSSQALQCTSGSSLCLLCRNLCIID